jgi:hypothetical protein
VYTWGRGVSWELYALINDVINYIHDDVEVWKVMNRYLSLWQKRNKYERKFIFYQTLARILCYDNRWRYCDRNYSSHVKWKNLYGIWILTLTLSLCVLFFLWARVRTTGLTTCFSETTCSLEILICNKFLKFLVLRLDSVFLFQFIRQLFVCSSYFSWS